MENRWRKGQRMIKVRENEQREGQWDLQVGTGQVG